MKRNEGDVFSDNDCMRKREGGNDGSGTYIGVLSGAFTTIVVFQLIGSNAFDGFSLGLVSE